MKLRWPFSPPGHSYDDLKRTVEEQEQAVKAAIEEADRVRMEAVQIRIEILRRTLGESP